MKHPFTLTLLLISTSALASDQVQMATSEDLNAFDAHLGAAQAAPSSKDLNKGTRAQPAIAAEAKKIKIERRRDQLVRQIPIKATSTENGVGRAGGSGSGSDVSDTGGAAQTNDSAKASNHGRRGHR